MLYNPPLVTHTLAFPTNPALHRTLNRHPVYAAMTFKLLKEADLGAFSLALMQRQHDAGRRLHGADSGLLAKARCHLEQSVASGEGSSGAACPAMLAALRCISPHEGHLLFSYAALGGRAGVVRALFMLSNVPHYTFFFRPCGAGEFLRYHQVCAALRCAAAGHVHAAMWAQCLGQHAGLGPHPLSLRTHCTRAHQTQCCPPNPMQHTTKASAVLQVPLPAYPTRILASF